MNKRLVISVVATAMAVMVSAVASAGSGRLVPGASKSNDLLPTSDIVASVLSYGLAPSGDPVLRGPYYVLHALNSFGREVRVVADAQFGDILSVMPVYSWRTNNARYGAIARIIHVPKDIFGGRGAKSSSQRRSDGAAATPGHVQNAKEDAALTPVYPTPDFGPKAGAKPDRLPAPARDTASPQRPE